MASSLIIIASALAGFGIALFIIIQKRKPVPLVCPIGFHCDAVVRSEHSKFFGIPLEVLGMLYYAMIALCYGIFLLVPTVFPFWFMPALLGGSIAAFFFSLYLIFIQAVVLKQWCTWCLASAFLSTIILLTSLIAAFDAAPLFLTMIRPLLIGTHLIGLALGLGAATITDLFFFRFLKDGRISHEESTVLHLLSDVIWFGLGLLFLSGLGIFLSNPDFYLASTKFLVKMVIVAVITVNGAFLTLSISPKLTTISFGGEHKHKSGELLRLRRKAFAMGAISITSWYFAFILGMMRSVPLSFSTLLTIYIVIVIVAVLASQLAERSFARAASK